MNPLQQTGIFFLVLGVVLWVWEVQKRTRIENRARDEKAQQLAVAKETIKRKRTEFIAKVEANFLQGFALALRRYYHRWSHRAIVWEGESYPSFISLVMKVGSNTEMPEPGLSALAKVVETSLKTHPNSGSISIMEATVSNRTTVTAPKVRAGTETLPEEEVPLALSNSVREIQRNYLSKVPSIGILKESRLPMPFPSEKVRLMHTYVIGKTRSGKTTFLEHLICEDLQQHTALAVISPGEGNWFIERVLPMIPEEDLDRLVYFAPGSSGNTLCFNPLDIEADDDAETAGDHIFGALRRAMRAEELGPRSTPILQNAISAVMSRCNGSTSSTRSCRQTPTWPPSRRPSPDGLASGPQNHRGTPHTGALSLFTEI